MLFELGETAYDRADITTKVFHEKLDRFLQNMRSGKYFGHRHKPTYELRVINQTNCKERCVRFRGQVK